MGSHKLTAENCLSFSFPNLVKEWNYDKNGDLLPSDVSYGSGKKVWWLCKNKHEWESAPLNRSIGGSNCPFCANQKVYSGNCLATLNPVLAKEWHPTKNEGTTPYNVTLHSNKIAWWVCKKGHEWKAVIGSRSSGNGCPYCSRIPKKNCNDNCLATKYPAISQEWDFEKNNFRPQDVFPSDKRKVWWRCRSGHEWQCAIVDRTSKNPRCYVCNGIVLNDGTKCGSLIETYYYLKFISEGYKNGLDFLYNREYASVHPEYLHVIGKRRYDFYFPKTDEYIEVSSFVTSRKERIDYFINIIFKSEYVTKILKSKFKYIQRTLSKSEMDFVFKNIIT